MTSPIQDNLFDCEYILTEEILVAVPPNHPLVKKANGQVPHQHSHPKIQIQELREESFILLKPNQKLHQIASNLCGQAGFKPHIILESESIEAAHALVSAGLGITFIPNTLTPLHMVSHQPFYFSIDNFMSTRDLVVAYRKGRYLSGAAKEFINIMKEVLS